MKLDLQYHRVDSPHRINTLPHPHQQSTEENTSSVAPAKALG